MSYLCFISINSVFKSVLLMQFSNLNVYIPLSRIILVKVNFTGSFFFIKFFKQFLSLTIFLFSYFSVYFSLSTSIPYVIFTISDMFINHSPVSWIYSVYLLLWTSSSPSPFQYSVYHSFFFSSKKLFYKFI